MSYAFTELSAPADIVARRLLGSFLIREVDGHQLVARIVETEAYDRDDPASHSYHGKTSRNTVMFGPPGRLYVYLSYGIHYCMNVVCGPEGSGAAVLIRALEPVEGIEYMSVKRGGKMGIVLTNGPGKCCQALQVDSILSGHDLIDPPLQLVLAAPVPDEQIVQTTRIGLSHAVDVPWRFYIQNNPYVSHAR